jgi:uncharacterized Zn-binding protein involved in type VI secretion
MGQLVAVKGDKNTHGHGDLDTNLGDNTIFVEGINIVVKGDRAQVPDDALHDPDETRAEGSSSSFYAYGILVHRQDDARLCGATTIVTGQSTVFSN